jgi:peptidoglycan/xylan/chitin deacetylase (PgdA/CDA1 family)
LKNFYLKNHGKLPKTVDEYINKFIFMINRRPHLGSRPLSKSFGIIEISPFKYDREAAFCVSADFELYWAWRFCDPKVAYNKAVEARNNFPLLLILFEKYSIPVTWATIGHLFLEKCDVGINGMPHQDMPRPTGSYRNKYWEWVSGDWYQQDPCTCVEKAPLWYAPDLIRAIIKSDLKHELATHSFSHIDFSDKSCSVELANREIEKCIEVMKTFGITPRSIVFPGNFEGHLDILSKLGVIAYRSYKSKIELSYPTRGKEGVWDIHTSASLRESRGYDFFERAKIFIKKAIENHLVYHIYFHPSDDNEIIRGTFAKILKYADKERYYGNLWIATMREIACYCEARETTSIHTNIDGKTINIKLNTKLDRTKYGDPEITLKINIQSGKTFESIEYDGKKIILGTENCYIKKSKDCKYLVITLPVSTNSLAVKLCNE